MTKIHDIDETVCTDIDEGLNDLLDKVGNAYPDQAVAGEFFLCLIQFAAELAKHGGASHQEFIDSASAVFGELVKEAARQTDPNLN